ncbi:MAG TPA: hypothetical protein PLP42_05495 [Acidobacteriota bacterium]|nr:hypothetical protein [Acidobacteriota bacterium]
MQRLLYHPFFTGIVLLLLLGNVFVFPQGTQQTSNTQTIPQAFRSLVPQGFTLDSPQTHKTAGGGIAMGGVTFRASKKLDPSRLVNKITYDFELKIMEYPDFMIKMQAQAYRDQLEKDIQERLKSWTSRHEENEFSPVVTYDKPQLKRYSWGAAITQKATHKYMGEGKGPGDEIAYECSYLGVLIDNRSIKLFDFSASGVSSVEEANGWADKASKKAAQTYAADL